MLNSWINQAFFYHIYPLGFCGAPAHNDFSAAPVPRLKKIEEWLPHLETLGANALYLGPVFESSVHGYDTADYYHVDRRLGDDALLAEISAGLHRRGFRLVLDGVFNHVGRDFWAFRDVQARGAASPYCDWFYNLRFNQRSPYGDPFVYEGWNGYYDLVKLNLANPAVREHLFQAVAQWVEHYSIDGLRLDAADCLDMDFLRALASFCKGLRPDFWLMGEVIHGDYTRWANSQTLDSVTNYECYKGLYSSLNDVNYFEIAYSLERQFGNNGIYKGLPLYSFVDNHDVDRVASQLIRPAQLFPLYALLFTMPGVPSIYYGSEWGIEGKKDNGSDAPLRPSLDLPRGDWRVPQPDLPAVIHRLSQLRRELPALSSGNYQQVFVSSEQLAFSRQVGEQQVQVVLNASSKKTRLELNIPGSKKCWQDLLNAGESFEVQRGRLSLDLYPCWARILV